MKNFKENNKMIAEFMGDISSMNAKVSFSKNCGVKDLQYHLSWDWLMPVVDKCYTSNIQHPNDDITQGLIDVDIESTYNAVVEFINQ